MVFSWLRLVFTVYVLFAGIYILSSHQLLQGFGLIFISYGTTIFLMGLISLGVLPLLKFGVNRHNRFVLFMSFLLDLIIMSVIINQCTVFMTYTVYEFPADLKLDCLRNTPETYSMADCLPYFESPRTLGFRAFWLSYYTDKKNKLSNQVLQNIQGDICCGFFAPLACNENAEKIPSDFLTTDIAPAIATQAVKCGNSYLSGTKRYYNATDDCKEFHDLTTIPPLFGGCKYDFAVGYCTAFDISPSSSGCASSTEDAVIALITPHIYMLLFSTLFNFISMTWACCMCWKRKETDVFPDYKTDLKYQIDYFKVKNQFEVKPKHQVLQKRGFLPLSEYEKMLAKRIADENLRNESRKNGVVLDEMGNVVTNDEKQIEEKDDDVEKG